MIESPHHWITKTEVLSNTCAFVWFNGLIIKLTSPFLRDIVLESLSVFMNDGESLLLFSKGVYREVKNLSNAHSQVWDNFWHLKDHKNDEKYLLFHLKSSFLSKYIQIFVLTFWSWGKNSLIRKVPNTHNFWLRYYFLEIFGAGVHMT